VLSTLTDSWRMPSAQCIKWGFEGCLVREFRGLTIDQDVENLVGNNNPLGSAAAPAPSSPSAGVWPRLAGAVQVRASPWLPQHTHHPRS